MKCSYTLIAILTGCALIPLTASGQPCLQWTQIDPSASPPARFAHSMVYDQARGATVLFGGEARLGDPQTLHDFGDTWTWDGSSWTLAATDGPSPRGGAAMFYDEARSVVILFGGVGPDPDTGVRTHWGDTWEWNGTSWRLVSEDGPSARREHVVTYDADRSIGVLYGGIGPSFPIDDDTWEWDGASWTLGASGTPSGRVKAAAVFTPSLGQSLLIGGQLDAGGSTTSQTWAWDGAVWTSKEAGPSLNGHCAAANPSTSRVVVFGGREGGNSSPILADTWVFEGGQWSMLDLDQSPAARQRSAMVFDEQSQGYVLFGGATGANAMDAPTGALGDTWILRDCSCRCDVDFSGHTDVFDLLSYLVGWFNQDPAADWDQRGEVTVFDLLGYLDCWFNASHGICS